MSRTCLESGPHVISESNLTTGAGDMPQGRGAELARESVYHKLRSEIIACVLRPGQLLQERDLVVRFDVSKSPIRDAILKLEEQGLIEVLPRKGYRVRQIDLADVRDMYQLREILERECIVLFLERATARELEGLEVFRSGPEGESLADWIDYNRAFHSYFARHCGNARLARIAQEMIEQLDRLTYVSVTSSSELSLDAFVREHGEIIDAVRDGDRRGALARARHHIQGSRKRVLESLETHSIIDRSREAR